jgi:hypothetical protein
MALATRRIRMAERRFRRKAEMALSSLPCAASRRPWIVEEHNDACFIVKEATGQALGYFYVEDEPALPPPAVARQEQAISIIALTILSGRGSCADQFRRFLGRRGAR